MLYNIVTKPSNDIMYLRNKTARSKATLYRGNYIPNGMRNVFVLKYCKHQPAL